MDWRASGKGIHLIKNIAELQIKFVFGHIANMGCRQDVRMRQQRVRGIVQRLCIECSPTNCAAALQQGLRL